MIKLGRLLMLFFCLLIAGCRFTDKDITKPKMFGGDFEALKQAFERIEDQKTTWQDLVEWGFDFNDSNIEDVDGPDAIRFVFPDTVFQGAVKSGEQLEALIQDLDRYRVVAIPHVDLTERRDRIYFTSRETVTVGHDARFTILFEDGVVKYHTKKIRSADRYRLAKAWGQGVLEFIGLARDATNLPNPKVPDALNNRD